MKAESKINGQEVGPGKPTYFIADIAANHDGSLERALKLIHLAKEAGADAAKFQNFKADKIVSAEGFSDLKTAHQAKWKKSVFEVYKDASVSQDWTPILKAECDKVGIHYFSSPYDFQSVDHLDPYVDVYKIGSGDITWIEMLQYMARKNKPLLLATGAASLGDVQRAVDAILPINKNLLLMQCNTNYTANIENYKYINLRVLDTFRSMYPGLPLGLSDHTHGHATVLGAVALGACAIEKHFTDDNHREGPDHAFAMNPQTWREMVDRTRELELALGDGNKKVEENEMRSVVVQQRSLCVTRDLPAGHKITKADIEALRPAPEGSFKPYEEKFVIGRTTSAALKKGQSLTAGVLQ